MTSDEMKSVATKIDPDTMAEVERITRETGLKTADLLRIGLRKLLKDYEATGKLEVGKGAYEPESPRDRAAGAKRRPLRASFRV